MANRALVLIVADSSSGDVVTRTVKDCRELYSVGAERLFLCRVFCRVVYNLRARVVLINRVSRASAAALSTVL